MIKPNDDLASHPGRVEMKIAELDRVINRFTAIVTQEREGGQDFYRSSDDGTYEVRVYDQLDSPGVRMIKRAVEGTGFVVVTEEELG